MACEPRRGSSCPGWRRRAGQASGVHRPGLAPSARDLPGRKRRHFRLAIPAGRVNSPFWGYLLMDWDELVLIPGFQPTGGAHPLPKHATRTRRRSGTFCLDTNLRTALCRRRQVEIKSYDAPIWSQPRPNRIPIPLATPICIIPTTSPLRARCSWDQHNDRRAPKSRPWKVARGAEWVFLAREGVVLRL